MKASNEHAVTVGWQVEKFAREGKKMKSLDDYLKTKSKPAEDGALGVRRLFEGMLERQEGTDGTR